MAVLNDWQKITRVLPGKPFGDEADGDLTVSASADQPQTKQSCSGTGGSTTLTLAVAAFSNGDIILIHQTRGTGVDQWEINQVLSGGGTTSLTLKKALQYTYTDSGASQAQAIKVPRYKNLVINTSVVWSAPAWDGNLGGIGVFAAKSVSGAGGLSSSARGHERGTADTGHGQTGGGSVGASVADQYTPNGSGGGGGQKGQTGGSQEGAGGGGGGNGVAGDRGHTLSVSNYGQGGLAVGTADFTSFSLGGGGGSGGADGQSRVGSGSHGGKGAGAWLVFSKEWTLTGSCPNTGDNGVNGDSGASWAGGGGGGAGGSFLLVCQTATLGSNLITALGGIHGNGNNQGGDTNNGGDGAVGRVAVHHSGTVSGTTNPTFTDVTDASLKESSGGGAFLFDF